MMMPLPSGRRANVSTPAGATAYVAECPNWVRTHTSQCSAILLSVPTPQTSSWRTAMGHAQALGLICSNLTPAQKAATPRADLVALATVFTTFFDAFRRTRAWIRSGVESELSSLLSCTVLIWLEYDTFAAIALESTLGRPTALLASLAAMGAAANPPCEDFMDTFVGCFHNCCTNFHIAKSSLEPLFLCAGVVEQFLRCCSHATNASSFDHVAGVVVIESGLILDQRSVRKNFAASKPAGIALQAAVARVKATTVYSRGKAAKALLKLARSAFVAQAVDRGAGDDEPKTTRMCRYCSGSKKKMNRCKQCGTAYYCDRKCQKADWKQHKKGCRKKAAKGAGGLSNLDHKSHVNMLQRFVNEQQIEIWSRRTVAIERLSGRSDPGQDVPPLAKWIVIIDMAEWKSTGCVCRSHGLLLLFLLLLLLLSDNLFQSFCLCLLFLVVCGRQTSGSSLQSL